jgi:hypothetical protein
MDSEEWDDDDSRYNNWTEFSAEASAFVKSGAMDEYGASTVLGIIEKGNANENRRSYCTSAIRLILMDYTGSPFKVVEEPPECRYCGGDLPEDASNSEEVCDDCSSIGCDCCGKTFWELGLDKRGIDEDPGYGRLVCDQCANYRCEECMRECNMCSDEVCMECIEIHSLEECEERTTGNVCFECGQDTFWQRDNYTKTEVPWCRNCDHEIDGSGRCVVTEHNKTLPDSITPRVVCSTCEEENFEEEQF